MSTNRERVDHEVLDEDGIAHNVERSKSGGLTVEVRVYGRLLIDGEEYDYDRHVRVRVTKSSRETRP
jgi:hypothetical protein